MRKELDERIVKMEFDNQNFEKNVTQSLSTLDRLSAALNLKGVGANFSAIGEVAENVGRRFGVLESIAFGALTNLGSKVTDWATGVIRDLSGVSNAMAGFNKFDQITRSTGTLKAQGFEMEEITEQLDRLSWFSDETSYSLTDMVDNISKFTATGQGLTESADAIEGIALWAALSGQNAGTAARAMYQLSQAMGSGYMRKEDWKSIQNMNMDTDEFRQKALDAAVAAGTLEKSADGMYRSLVGAGKAGSQWFEKAQFAEHLTQDAWFTKDVMMDVYREYSNAVDKIYQYTEEHGVTASVAILELQDELDGFGLKAFRAAQEARTWSDVIEATKDALSSGWMTIFQLVIGNYEEATAFFTSVANEFYDIFVEPVNGLAESVSKWSMGGGAKALREAVVDIFPPILKFIQVIRDSFVEIFPIDIVNTLGKVTSWFILFAANLQNASERTINLRRILKGIFSVFSIMFQAIKGFVKALKPLFSGVDTVGKSIGDTAGKIGLYIKNLDAAIKKGDVFYKFFSKIVAKIVVFRDKIVNFARIAYEYLSFAFTAAKEPAKEFFDTLITPLKNVANKVREFISKIRDSFIKGFGDKQLSGAKGLTRFASMATFAQNVVSIFVKATAGLKKANEVIQSLFVTLTGKSPAEVLDSIGNGIAKLSEGIGSFLGDADRLKKFVEFLKSAANLIWRIVSSIWNVVKKFFGNILGAFKQIDFGTAGGLAVGGGLVYGFLKLKDVITGFIDNLTNKGILDKLKGLIDKIGEPFKKLSSLLDSFAHSIDAKALKNVGVAILLVATALLVLSMIPIADLMKALGAMTVFLGEVSGIMLLANKFGDAKKIKAVGKAFSNIGAGLLLMAVALAILSKIEPEQLKISMLVMTAMLAVLALFIVAVDNAAKKGKGITKAAKAMTKIGTAMILMAVALKIIASIKPEQMKTALIGFAALIVGILAVTLALDGKDKSAIKTAKAIQKIALALVVMSLALKILASIEPERMTTALIAFGVAIVGILALILALDKAKVSASAGVAIIGIATAMLILTAAITKLGQLKMAEILQGGIAVIALLASIAVFSKVVSDEPLIKIGVGLIALAAGIAIFAKVIETMGKLDWKVLLIGVGAFVAILASVVVAAKLLTGSTASLYALSVFFIAFGTGAMLFGAALILIGVGLASLATGITAVLGVVDKLVDTILVALEKLIPGLGNLVPLLIETVVDAILRSAKSILKLAVGLLTIFCQGLLQSSHVILSTAAQLLAMVAKFLTDNQETIFTTITTLIDIACQAIEDSSESIASAAGSLLRAFIDEFTSEESLKSLTDAGWNIINAILDGIDENIDEVTNKAVDIVIKFLNTIETRMPDIVDAGFKLVISFINGLSDAIDENWPEIQRAADRLVTSVVRAITMSLSFGKIDLYKEFPSLPEKGILESFGDWVAEKGQKIKDKAKEIVDKMIEGIKSKWQDVKDAVKHLADGFVEGIREFFTPTYAKMQGVAGKQLSAFESVYEINSPSKKMKWEAKMISQGLVGGLETYGGAAVQASETVGENMLKGFEGAIQGVYDLVDGSMDYDPVIRPILDLTDLENGMTKANGMFRNRPMFSGVLSRNLSAIDGMQKTDQTTNSAANSGTINYTQYNYSPKALNAIEIYRRTRNQLSAMKGRVGAR